MNLNSVLLRATGVAALGGLLFGFDTAVISGTTSALSQVFDLSSKSLGITVSIAIWGTVVGAMLAGFPGERYGRRDSLRGLALFYLISALGCAFAWNWWSLVAFRLSEDWALAVRQYWDRCILPRLPPRNGGEDWSDCFSSTWCSVFSSHIFPITSLLCCIWAQPNGVGTWELPRFRRRYFLCYCSRFHAVRAGWSRRDVSPRPGQSCR